MTKTLDIAIEKVKSLSENKQEEVAEAILNLVAAAPYTPSPAEQASIETGLAHAEAGEFASDKSVRSVFEKLKNLRTA